jgi:hypothetical protein
MPCRATTTGHNHRWRGAGPLQHGGAKVADDPARGHDGHAAAARLRRGLKSLVLLLAALTAWAWMHELAVTALAVSDWPTFEGRIESRPADQRVMTVEVEQAVADRYPTWPRPDMAAPREGQAWVLLPQPAQLWADGFDTVVFAVDPDPPHRVRPLDPLALLVPPLSGLLLLLLLGGAWVGVQRLPWGRDQIWLQGRWQDTAGQGLRPGERAAPADRLHEPQAHHRGTRFWAIVMTLLTLLVVVGAIVEGVPSLAATEWLSHLSPLMIGLSLALLALDLLLLHQFVTVRTRQTRFDVDGIADSSFFQTRRVPWAAVTSFDKVNTSRAAQEAWDRDFRRSGNRTRGRSRPTSSWSWIARDAGGQELLRLAEDLEREPAFDALRRRLQARLRPQSTGFGAVGIGIDGATVPTQDGVDQAMRDQLRQHRLHGVQSGLSVLALLLTLSPFLFGTALSTGRAIWFSTWAERAPGTVVEKSEDGLPSLVVAYTPPGGPTLRVQSDGTEAYGAIPLGATITVFYDAADPQHARLDLFLELWLWPMILGGLTLLVGLPLMLAMGLMRRTARGSP